MSYEWRKSKKQPLHTDDWLMTYADVITLLLCFFAIIVMVSVPKKNVQPKTPVVVALEQPKEAPPPQPVVDLPKARPLDIFPGNLPFHDLAADDDVETPPVPDPVKVATPVEDPASIPAAREANVAPPPSLPALQAAAPDKPVVPPTTEPKGDRITVLEMNSAAFFDSGSAVLSSAGMQILRPIAEKLNADPYKGYQVTVEGHTDDTPIHTLQFPSNWELSTARASAVVHFFLTQGVPAQRLRAAGYADTFPKAANRDADGKPIAANRAANRRVVIKLEKIEKTKE